MVEAGRREGRGTEVVVRGRGAPALSTGLRSATGASSTKSYLLNGGSGTSWFVEGRGVGAGELFRESIISAGFFSQALAVNDTNCNPDLVPEIKQICWMPGRLQLRISTSSNHMQCLEKKSIEKNQDSFKFTIYS
ncbi:hypothetical protein NL676_009154 [Syzygium grande]|nr:hypothetical protein NL676_009154 [Syzygium grande]